MCVVPKIFLQSLQRYSEIFSPLTDVSCYMFHRLRRSCLKIRSVFTQELNVVDESDVKTVKKVILELSMRRVLCLLIIFV